MKFEDYLKRVHTATYTGTDDSMPEAFDHWLTQLDIQELIDMAESWGEELAKEIRDLVKSEIK